MVKSPVLRLAQNWKPAPSAPNGEDQSRLVAYLLQSNARATNPVSIPRILEDVEFARSYNRHSLQHRLVGPLQKRKGIFVGWNRGGLFRATSAEDADAALATYTARARAELHHARNLEALAKRTRLFEGYVSKPPGVAAFIGGAGSSDVASRECL